MIDNRPLHFSSWRLIPIIFTWRYEAYGQSSFGTQLPGLHHGFADASSAGQPVRLYADIWAHIR